jgi:hypothetical protein
MTEAPKPLPDEEPEQVPLTEWNPVASWPPEMRDAIADLENVGHVLDLMGGGGRAGDELYRIARGFLTETQQGLRSDLAARVLALHGLDELLERQQPEERTL